MRRLSPSSIHPPFAHYVHGVEISPGARVVVTSGQVGVGRDGATPEGVEAQAHLCFRSLVAILGEAGMTLADVVKLNAYVTSTEYVAAYQKVRDQFMNGPPAAATLLVVQGLARAEYKVEVEAIAARAT